MKEPNGKNSVENANVILLGQTGGGKTSLLNNLCGTNEPVGFAKYNLTQTITSADCCFLPKGSSLHIYDTPGIIEDSNKGLLQIEWALKYLSWNLIIILGRFEARYKINTVPPIKKFLKLFK
jgi:ribosome-interacting GTPase 1